MKTLYKIVLLVVCVFALTAEASAQNKVYNTETGLWYDTITSIFYAGFPQTGEIIVFGNTTEFNRWTNYFNDASGVRKNIKIRAAKTDNAGDIALANSKGIAIDPNGYTITWDQSQINRDFNHENPIIIATGKTQDYTNPVFIFGGTNSGPLTFDFDNINRGLTITGVAYVIIGQNVTFKNGKVKGEGTELFGGAVWCDGKLEVNGATFENNYADLGGAIHVSDEGAVQTYINGATFKGNAVKSGNRGKAMDIKKNVSISGNIVTDSGQDIFITNETYALIKGGTITSSSINVSLGNNNKGTNILLSGGSGEKAVVESDADRFNVTTTKSYSAGYDDNEGNPVIRLVEMVNRIYSTKGVDDRHWFSSLYDLTKDKGFQTGDAIILFDNTTETHRFSNMHNAGSSNRFEKNIIIRAAKAGKDDDRAAESSRPTISTDGYTITWDITPDYTTPDPLLKAIMTEDALWDPVFIFGGDNSGPLTFDFNGINRGLEINEHANVGIGTNVTFKNGKVQGYGGAIYNDGVLTVDGATFKDNYGDSGSGAIHTTNSNSGKTSLYIKNATFEGNSVGSGKYGKAMSIMDNVYISGNIDLAEGQDIYIGDNPLIKNGEISSSDIYVSLKTNTAGTNIMVSKDGASSAADGMVISDDAALFTVLTTSDYVPEFNANKSGKAVIELVAPAPTAVDLTLMKKNMVAGESAIVTVSGEGADYVVALTAGSNGIATATLKDLIPGTYTITDKSWSWAYGKAATSSVTLSESKEVEITTEAKSSAPQHAESSKNNVFSNPL